MKLIILLLLPCLAFGMSIPSSVVQPVERQTVNLDVAGSTPAGTEFCGGAQSVDCKPLPVDILQLTPQEQAWFLVFMVVAFVIIEAGNG